VLGLSQVGAESQETCPHGVELVAQRVERLAIRARPRAYDDVQRSNGFGRTKRTEERSSSELAQPALELVSLDGRVAVFRYYQPNPSLGAGGAGAHVERGGTCPSPGTGDSLQFGATR